MIFNIGADGLTPINTNIRIQANTPYYIGASSSPSRIIVTRVEGDNFWYRTYPYNGRELLGDAICRSLVRRGTVTRVANIKDYLRRHLAHGEDDELRDEYLTEIEAFEKLLAGEPAPELVEDPEGLKYGHALLTAGEGPHPRGDAWYSAEHYGGVGGITIDGVEHYRVRTQAKLIDAIKVDPKLVFVSFDLEPVDA